MSNKEIMTTEAQPDLPATPQRKQTWRVVAAMLTAATSMALLYVLGVRAGLLVQHAVPHSAYPLLPVLCCLAVGFFASGMLARLVAGPTLHKDRLGFACAVVIVLLMVALALLPKGHFIYHTISVEPPQPPFHLALENVMVNLVLYALLLALASALAQRGDRWMTRRLEARRRPRFEAEA